MIFLCFFIISCLIKISSVLALCGGSDLTSIEKYPFVVNICADSGPTRRNKLVNGTFDIPACVDGAILAKDWVLGPKTHHIKEPLTTVWFGRKDMNDTDPEKKRTVIDIVHLVHIKRFINHTDALMSLYKLDKCIKYSKTAQPVKLPPQNQPIPHKQSLVFVGTGKPCTAEPFTPKFQVMDAIAIANEECQMFFPIQKKFLGSENPPVLVDYIFCTFHPGKGGVCADYYGTPAVSKDGFLVGLSLFKVKLDKNPDECDAVGADSGFWNVSNYIENIEIVTGLKRNATTGYLEGNEYKEKMNTKYFYDVKIDVLSKNFTETKARTYVGITLLLIYIFVYILNLNYQ